MPRPRLKKRPDGRYCCKYKDKRFYGNTVSEAFAARDAYIREQERAANEHPTITVADYTWKWLPIHKASVTDRTYNGYAKLANIIINSLGAKAMEDVTVSDIKSIYSTYFAGKSESYIHKAKTIYTEIWDTALEDGIVTHNPCRSEQARPHKGTVGTHRALTPEEDQLILSMPHPFRLAMLVMRYAGLRRGEALALDIDRDVDFKNQVIHVREAVRYDSNAAIISDPKTKAGIRDVPLFSILAKELEGHHGLLAPSAVGVVMSNSAFMSMWESYKAAAETKMNGISKRWYGRTREQKALEKEKTLPPWRQFTVRVHDLRHSFCTMLRDSGVDLKLAIMWMGHADEKMILHIYDHVTENRIQSAIKSVEFSLKGVKTGVN